MFDTLLFTNNTIRRFKILLKNVSLSIDYLRSGSPVITNIESRVEFPKDVGRYPSYSQDQL